MLEISLILIDTFGQMEENQRGLNSLIAKLEEQNHKLLRDFEDCQQDKARLESDCALLTQKLETSRSEVR